MPQPDVIGAYRIVDQLGEGGMGAVFLGKHTLLEREVAIKVLLPQYSSDADIMRRFFNEARALTQINDPGIVQIFDFGFHDNAAFIVMERLAGESIEDRQARIGRFQPLECIRLIRMACASLEVAHRKQIVHRDLKPSNIYIVRDPIAASGERAKILDFGIAKLANEPGVTHARTLVGTPLYMSPEQCRALGDIDHRSDIYAIGCVMMTMLTGAPPFVLESMADVVSAQLNQPPPPVSSRVDSLPQLLDEIVLRALAKAKEERFQSMADLAYALADAEQVVMRAQQHTQRVALTFSSAPTQTTLSGASGEASERRLRRVPVVVGALAALTVAIAIAIAVRSDHRDLAIRLPAATAPVGDGGIVQIHHDAPIAPPAAIETTPTPEAPPPPSRKQPSRGHKHAPNRPTRPTATVDRSD